MTGYHGSHVLSCRSEVVRQTKSENARQSAVNVNAVIQNKGKREEKRDRKTDHGPPINSEARANAQCM